MQHLTELTSRGTTAVKAYRRATALLALHQGQSYSAVGRQLGVRYDTVAEWAKQFTARGLAMLQDQPRSGRSMETLLPLYAQHYDPRFPVVCFGKRPCFLLGNVVEGLAPQPLTLHSSCGRLFFCCHIPRHPGERRPPHHAHARRGRLFYGAARAVVHGPLWVVAAAPYLTFVVRSSVRTYATDTHGKEYVLAFATEGWWCTDSAAFFNRTPATLTLQDLKAIDVLHLSLDHLEQLCQRVPKFKRPDPKRLSAVAAPPRSSLEAGGRSLLRAV